MYVQLVQILKLKASLRQQTLVPSERQGLRSVNDNGQRAVFKALQWLANARGLSVHPLGTGLMVLAALLGAVTLAGLLQTPTGQPVNLLYLLLVFGPLQWVFMVAGILTLARGNTPLLTPLLDRGLGQIDVPPRLASAVFFHLNQGLSLAFHLAALIAFLLFLAFKDLAFGWQTTLQWTSDSLAGQLAWLAWPWSTLWPEAVPHLDWVTQTRFMPMADPARDPATALAYGQWWRFIVAYMMFYSLLPRCLLWLVAQRHLRAQVLHWVSLDTQLYPVVNAIGSGAELEMDQSPSQNSQGVQALDRGQPDTLQALPNADTTFYWKVAAPDGVSEAQQLGLPDQWHDDELRLSTLTETSCCNLVVPGWEAPTTELADLMATLPNQQGIHIILLPLRRPLTPGQQKSWEQFMATWLPQAQLSVLSEAL